MCFPIDGSRLTISGTNVMNNISDSFSGSSNSDVLRQSEERFRLLVEGVSDYAIFLLDPEGYIISWNAGAERIKGYRAEEIMGHHFSQFYPQEAIDRQWPEYELRMACAEGRFEDEGWRIRKDGTRFWANVVITALFDEHGIHVGFAKITRDLTDRKRIEALELAEKRMTEFLAMLSHELRNPLAPIRNAVYLMQLKELDDPELKWTRDVIDRQVTQMTRLVDDLLEVSRVTSGSIRLHREKIKIGVIIARAIESCSPLIELRRHRLDVVMPDRSLSVEGDLTRLTQVVVNLLNNAAKYTPEGGRIRLTVEEEQGKALIHVRDNGAGIPSEFLKNVFDLFAQGDRTLDRSEGGLGIGLTLVKRLVEMHGGKVEAFSQGPGQGSEFVVTLPLVVDTSAATDANEAESSAMSSRASGLRVLVVDDNRDVAISMQMFLRAWGHDVRTAHDGLTALEAAREYQPDIVLLDIGLPKMDGYEVATRIRELPGGEKMWLIALTGYGQAEDRRRTHQLGIAHHLVKPVDPDMLRELLVSMKGAVGR
jgi:PAS domain S-box-containing protein